MATSGEIVRKAFDDWTDGTAYVSSIFAPDMTWEIVGHSDASGRYATAQEFQEKVLIPFGQRFKPDQPFRPVTIRGFFVDADSVIVIWDGEGTTVADTTYRNTYAWIMTLRDGQVVDGIAFYDSISFNELWKIQPRAS
ncbi:nuclear transport factor 2 family protein [Jatrophihabitans sp. DSM 45814]